MGLRGVSWGWVGRGVGGEGTEGAYGWEGLGGWLGVTEVVGGREEVVDGAVAVSVAIVVCFWVGREKAGGAVVFVRMRDAAFFKLFSSKTFGEKQGAPSPPSNSESQLPASGTDPHITRSTLHHRQPSSQWLQRHAGGV